MTTTKSFLMEAKVRSEGKKIEAKVPHWRKPSGTFASSHLQIRVSWLLTLEMMQTHLLTIAAFQTFQGGGSECKH